LATHESFLAFGHVLPLPAEDVLKRLLIAAHEQGRVPETRQRDLLDDPDARDPDYQITQLDLHVQALPANPRSNASWRRASTPPTTAICSGSTTTISRPTTKTRYASTRPSASSV
jgi:hypothetical protein